MPKLNILNKVNPEDLLLYGVMALVGLFTFIGIYTELYFLGLAPLLLFFIYKVIQDYTLPYYLFFFVVPFSIEYNFADTLGTDLPSEQLMWIITGISILIFFYKFRHFKGKRYINLITGLIVLNFVWYMVSSVNSTYPGMSWKIVLAKLWYIIPFYFFTIHTLKTEVQVDKMIHWTIYTLAISALVVLVRHGATGFSFAEANLIVNPPFRNHVTYASILVLLVPFVWYKFSTAEISKKSLYLTILIIFTIAIYFSYTRAAMLCVVMIPLIFSIVKFKMMRYAIFTSVVVTGMGLAYLLTNNNYLKYAPKYEKAISHADFDKLLTATVELEDVSTMERVYRWVAGIEMIKHKPLLGCGPGTFVKNYKNYTVNSFKTYVSNNIDGSTVHCYFMLVLIEQGLFGFIIFMVLCFYVLIYGENRYHKMHKKEDKAIIMASIICLVIILLINTINDMIETDKVGPFFFMCIAIIASYKRGQESAGEENNIESKTSF